MFWPFKRKRQKPVEREIFVYWDGSQYRRIDPIQAQIALDRHPTYNEQRDPELVDQGDPEAIEKATQAVSDVFGIPELSDEAGLTMGERLGVLMRFYEYVTGLKKNTSPLPIPSSPLEEIYTHFTGKDPGKPSSDSGMESDGPRSDTPTESGPQPMQSSGQDSMANPSPSDSTPPPTTIPNGEQQSLNNIGSA